VQIQREIADGTLQIPQPRERVAAEVDPAAADSPATSNDDTEGQAASAPA
jgi:hypothetical protein